MRESNFIPPELNTEMQNSLESESIGLENITSIDAMCAILREQKEIKGTDKVYSPGEIIKRIEQIRHGHRPLNFITRTYGIRDALERLLPNDKTFIKYTKNKK